MKESSNGHALSVSNLRFSYPDGPVALDGIGVSVDAGEKVGLIGPNGAGKTTLFLSICGVLKPDEGGISLFGSSVEAGTFRPEIGLVFQNPDDQLFCPSVREDVAFGPRNMGFSKEEIEARVKEAMLDAGVEGFAERAPHHLSGGEKRMVSIAGALAMKPKLIAYDEPSANLDIRSRRRLIRFLQNSDHTVLLSSHDLELVLEVCDRVVLMDDGNIVAEGDPRQLMGDEDLMEKHGLEKPHSLVPHGNTRHGT
ncbi:MAG: energy-coupling factor ABC transporter ATP-binding protein [Rubrobacteraceae bacterium]